jgi:hypothetical protein
MLSSDGALQFAVFETISFIFWRRGEAAEINDLPRAKHSVMIMDRRINLKRHIHSSLSLLATVRQGTNIGTWAGTPPEDPR